MSKKFLKIFSSCAMAAVLAFTSAAAQATEAVDADVEAELGINDYAENIKNIYKTDYPEQADKIDEIVDAISNSNEFIRIFESEGKSAFKIIEDSLRDMLDPSAVPLMQIEDLYTSEYPFIELVHPNDLSEYTDSAAAVTVMALTGSGVEGYDATINTAITDVSQEKIAVLIYKDSSKNANITDITKVLSEKVKRTGQENYTFVTKAFTDLKNNYNRIYNTFADSLLKDATPIIKIKGATLPYYKYYPTQTQSSSQYLLVRDIDLYSQEISVVDPNCFNGRAYNHTISFANFENMIKNLDVLWVSAYVPDTSAQALSELLAEYPNGSYFNSTKNKDTPCTCHSWCDWNIRINTTTGEKCTCILEYGGIQCAGFARYVYTKIKGVSYTTAAKTNKITINKNFSSADDAKKMLQGLSTGTYIYGKVSGGSPHALAIIATSENGITTYEANYASAFPCRVRYRTLSWAEFAAYLPYIQEIVQ